MNVLIESQEIPVKALEEGMNLTESLIDSVVFYIIDHIVDNKSIFSIDLEKVVGFGMVGGTILTSKLLASNKTNAITMYRVYGFNMGLMLGATVSLGVLNKLISPKANMNNNMIKFATKLGYMFIKKQTKLVNKISKLINPILNKILTIPSYEKHLESIVRDNKSLDGKEVFKAFTNSYLFGVVIGAIGGALFAMKYIEDLSKALNYVEASPKLDPNLKNLLIFSISAVKNPEIIQSLSTSVLSNIKLNNINKKSDESFLNIIKKISLGITTPKPSSRKYIKLYSNKKLHNYKQAHINKQLELAIDRLFSAVVLVDKKDKNFSKLIATVYVKFGNYDNAHVSFSSTKNDKYDITFVFNTNGRSKWLDFTVEEFAAVIFHELGHVVTGAFYVLPVEMVSYIFLSIAISVLGGYGSELVKFAQVYNMVNVARIAEMQADAYAIRKGFGDALASALGKITPASKELDDIVLLTSHGSNLKRIDQIGKVYNTIKQEIKKL